MRGRGGQRRKTRYAQPCQWFVQLRDPSAIPVDTNAIAPQYGHFTEARNTANGLGTANVVPRQWGVSVKRLSRNIFARVRHALRNPEHLAQAADIDARNRCLAGPLARRSVNVARRIIVPAPITRARQHRGGLDV